MTSSQRSRAFGLANESSLLCWWYAFMVMAYIASTYLFETDEGYQIFAAAQVITVGTGLFSILSDRFVFAPRFLVWVSVLLVIASALALASGNGPTSEFRTFFVNCVGVLACIQLVSATGRFRLAILSIVAAGGLASVKLLVGLDRISLSDVGVRQSWSFRSGSELPGGNPNIAGMYLAISFGLSVGMALKAKESGWVRCGYLALALVNFGGVTATGSRNALLFCSVCFLLAVATMRLRYLPLAIGVGILLFSIFIRVDWIYNLVGHRLAGVNTLTSDQSRIVAATEALVGFSMHPLGSGFGSSSLFLSAVHYTHSNYLEILVSLGLVGAICYYFIYFVVVRGLIAVRGQLSLVLLVPTLALVLYELFQVTYLSKAPLLLLGIGVAYVWSSGRFEGIGVVRGSGLPYRPRGCGALGTGRILDTSILKSATAVEGPRGD